MICQICGKHNASIRLQQIIGETTKELYLCKACAKKHNLYTDERKIHHSLKALFERLLPKSAQREEPYKREHLEICPDCGTPLSLVKGKKTLGCPHCFFYFRDTVIKLLQENNGDLFYAGHLPTQLETLLDSELSLQQLKAELQKAVINEEYELAAYFRDKIKERGASI